MIGGLLLALVVYYIATDPTGAGHTGKTALHGAQTFAAAVITVLTTLSH